MNVPAEEVTAGDYISVQAQGLNGVFAVHVKEKPSDGEIGLHILAGKDGSRRLVYGLAEEVKVVRPWSGRHEIGSK